jgi:hypothetical protein
MLKDRLSDTKTVASLEGDYHIQSVYAPFLLVEGQANAIIDFALQFLKGDFSIAVPSLSCEISHLVIISFVSSTSITWDA